MLLASCSTVGKVALSSLTNSGGPSLDAQIGQTNSKTYTVGVVDQVSGDKVTKTVETAEVVNVQQTPFWFIVALILGWILPSPNEIGRTVVGWFKRK